MINLIVRQQLLFSLGLVVIVSVSAQGNFYEWRFRNAVSRALNSIETILENTRRNPRLLEEEEDHVYDDKYAVAEYVTNTAISSVITVLGKFGVTSKILQNTLDWVHEDNGTVILRFEAEDSCSFLKEEQVVIRPKNSVEHEIKTSSDGVLGHMFSKTEHIETAVIRKVTEYHWKVGISYKISLLKNHKTPLATIQSRNASSVIITTGGSKGEKYAPRPVKTIHDPLDINLTWLIQMLSPPTKDKLISQFNIDRSLSDYETNSSDTGKKNKSCKTPRRNDEVTEALNFFQKFRTWSSDVGTFFDFKVVSAILGKHDPAVPDMTSGIHPRDTFSGVRNLEKRLFVPVIPLMDKNEGLSDVDTTLFLNHQKEKIDVLSDELAKNFPSPSAPNEIISRAEATLVLLCMHLNKIIDQYEDGINYIENLLQKQLVQAIGKEIGPKDFEEFMQFHHKKLFGDKYAPNPFSYAIRRPNHYPDGILSIESTASDGEPIKTFVKKYEAASGVKTDDDDTLPFFIPINAATTIEIQGDRYLHGWMQHRWTEYTPSRQFQLVARTHQFSSFLLIIGTLAGPNKFQPKNAIILQNKDEILIPLLTDVLPSAQEFKDAIASLSPEQKAFAQAFRGMQLESSVFGVCVVQLKPQLEKLLGLPNGSLTKQIQLTQDLMSLFVDYQIPSDLVSFEETSVTNITNITVMDKIDAVRGHVKAVNSVIESAKEKQLREEAMKADMRDVQNDRRPTTAPAVAPSAAPSAAPSGAPSALPSSSSAPSAAPSLSSVPSGAPSALPSSSSSARSMRTGRRLGGESIEMMMAPEAEMMAMGAKPKRMMASKASKSSDLPDEDRQIEEEISSSQESFQSMKESSISAHDDFTLIPKLLDSKFEKYDTDGSLRSTIIKVDQVWTRTRQENLLTKNTKENLSIDRIKSEKKKAFDLLVALSRSGSLPIDNTELHVIIGVSHCFEHDVMTTIIQDNINPIDKVEKSALMIASTIYGQPTNGLIGDSDTLKRLATSFPVLFDPSSDKLKEDINIG